MEPYESGGKRTREEETPSAIWTEAEGGGSAFSPCRGDQRDRGRRIRSAISATGCICARRAVPAMRPLTCQPCIARKDRSGRLTKMQTFRIAFFAGLGKKNRALLEGRAGPVLREAKGLPQGGTPASEEGEKYPQASGRGMTRPAAALNRGRGMSAMRAVHIVRILANSPVPWGNCRAHSRQRGTPDRTSGRLQTSPGFPLSWE
jgi:hypothetical protein